ncbi:MAG: putative toxin-antitoxin system toxin component, PIN family, partial [Victivallales bacterium]
RSGMRVVIDTNVLVSGIFWRGKPFQILNFWSNGSIEVVASAEILEEYTRVLREIGRRYGRSDLAESWNGFIFQNVRIVEAKAQFKKCRDPFDNKFIDCAISSDAEIIISGDDDLISLEHVGKILILNCEQAFSFLDKRGSAS